jgi:hypothetical protein
MNKPGQYLWIIREYSDYGHGLMHLASDSVPLNCLHDALIQYIERPKQVIKLHAWFDALSERFQTAAFVHQEFAAVELSYHDMIQ